MFYLPFSFGRTEVSFNFVIWSKRKSINSNKDWIRGKHLVFYNEKPYHDLFWNSSWYYNCTCSKTPLLNCTKNIYVCILWLSMVMALLLTRMNQGQVMGHNTTLSQLTLTEIRYLLLHKKYQCIKTLWPISTAVHTTHLKVF